MAAAAALATPAVYPAFFFVLEKAVKSAANALIPTFPTRWSHGLQHLRRKRPTFAFALESGYTLAFRRRIAHNGLHTETGVFRTGALSLPSERSTRFGNPAGPGFKTANFAAFGSGSGVLPKNAESLGTAMRSCASLLRGVAAPLGCVIFFASAEIGICTSGAHGFPRVRGGGGITTLGAFRTFTNIPGPGIRTAYFAAFGSWPGVRSRRTQRAFGTAMRLYASLSRGVAAPLGCATFLLLSKLRLVRPALRVFPRVRDEGWYHHSWCALRASETPDGRLQKRLTCRFLRSGGRSSPLDSYFLANTQNFLLAVPVANTFALWYDKFDKLELSN